MKGQFSLRYFKYIKKKLDRFYQAEEKNKKNKIKFIKIEALSKGNVEFNGNFDIWQWIIQANIGSER